MRRTVRAIFDHGVLRPLERIDLPEHGEVTLVIVDGDDDIASDEAATVAAAGGAFDFLGDPAEDVYTREDGEPV